MPSKYLSFAVNLRNDTGTVSAPEGLNVIIHDADADADIDTVTTNSEGEIDEGTVAADVGTLLIFRIEDYFGRAASTAQITKEI